MFRSRRLSRSLLAIGAMLASVVAVVVVPAQPAAAAIPSLQVAHGDSGTSGAQRFAVAICPQGQKVYSGGYQVLAGGDERWVTVTEFAPSSTLGSVRVTANATSAHMVNASHWIVRAYATCGPPQPTHVLSPMGTSHHNTGSGKSALTSCPTGTVPYSVFGRIIDAPSSATFTTMVTNGGTGALVQAQALVHNPPLSPWSVRGWAICATRHPGYQLSHTQQRCPWQQNLTVLGGGFAVTGNQGRVVVSLLMPRTGSSGLASTVGIQHRAVSVDSDWHVTVEAICT